MKPQTTPSNAFHVGAAMIATALLFIMPVHGAEVQINAAEQNEPPVVANAQAFTEGKVFYHAVPSTPAVGHSYKIINTSNDTDFIIKIYELKNTNIAYEVRDIVIKTAQMEGGTVSAYIDTQTGKEYVAVTAPEFQFPYIEAAVNLMDKPGTSYEKSGSARIWYTCQNRKASELQDAITKTLGTSYGDLVVDDRINKIMYKDAPSVRDRVAKWLPYFDVPPEQVRIDAQIIECEADNDFNFGLALEAWKEALPERVDTVLTFNQSKTSLSPGPDTAVKGALESINIQGMRPKAAANFINYLLRTGKAKVLSCPTVVAINGQQSVITSVDNLSYKAYSDTGTSTSKLGKQAGTGVSLTITPTITEETLTLSMNATVNSLVSWAAGNEPIINTRTTTATVVLKDGELFTMSGLKRDTIAKEDERVPILGSCPLIGYAFRHEIDVKKTSEIVILLTPHKVTASTGVLERERQLLNETKETVDKRDTRAGMQTFYDRVILNVKE